MRAFFIFFLLLLCSDVLAHDAKTESCDSDLKRAEVINFPEPYRIEGKVAVEGPVTHGVLFKTRKLTIPPVITYESHNMLDVGVIDTAGFTSCIISLQGQVKDSDFIPGTVGIILIPDEKPILRAFLDDRLRLFGFDGRSIMDEGIFPYFTYQSERITIAFPGYRAFLYNTTGNTVEVNLYIYLTN